jgi:hypothetical protein
MEHDNPYRAPLAGGRIPTEADLVSVEVVEAYPQWRWLNYLLVPREATLPSRCVKCGVATDSPLRRQKVYWYSPWLFLTLVFGGLLIFAVLVMILQKKGVVHFALCDQHASRRRWIIALAWFLSLGGIAMFIGGFVLIDRMGDAFGILMLTGLVALLFGLIIGIAGARSLNVKYIDKHVIWLNKLPEPFYAHLPQLATADGRNPIGPWSQT